MAPPDELLVARNGAHLGLPSSAAVAQTPIGQGLLEEGGWAQLMKMRLAMVVAAAGITGSFWACKDSPLPLEEHGNTPAEDAAAFATGNHGKGKGSGGGGGAGGGGGHTRAKVLREEQSAQGEVRLYSGAVADLDGDGDLELVAGGFASEEDGRRSTMRVYRQAGEGWTPWLEAGWDGGKGSTARNLEIGDVDGDGVLDMVLLGRVGERSRTAKARMAIFALVNGALVEKRQQEWLEGTYTHGYGLALGDLDGDRRLEIVTAGFEFDGEREQGFVRVWNDPGKQGAALVLRAQLLLGAPEVASMRVNDLAIGDVDGDGRPELVVAGRRGGLKVEGTAPRGLDERRETGDLTVLRYAAGKLTERAHFSWKRGTSLRLRSVVVADLDGDQRAEIVAGGQYDAEGRAALGLFRMRGGKLVLVDDASMASQGVTGEIKDLVVVGRGGEARIVATGVAGARPARQGNLGAWRLTGDKLVSDAELISRNADETRSRAVVVVPGADGGTVLTIGHARQQTDSRSVMVGQVLRWPLDTGTN